MAADPVGGGTISPAVGTHTDYTAGAVENITATPNSGYHFNHWSSNVADPNSASTTVTMDGDKTVTANFELIPAPTPSNTMHVSNIDMSFKKDFAGNNTFYTAIATVTIVDDNIEPNPVEGATVSGHWSETTTDSDSGITDANGEVSLESKKVKNPSSGTTFTFTVDNVTKDGWTYNSSANTETSDSISVP